MPKASQPKASQPTLWRTRHFRADSWLDLLPVTERDAFAFEGYQAGEERVARLMRMIDPRRNPGGSTILVTGMPGAGKTSLVSYAIFHAALLSRFTPSDKLRKVVAEGKGAYARQAWYEYRDAMLKPSSRSESPLRGRDEEAVALFDVWIPLPDPTMSDEEVLRRTLRNLYFRLVTSGIADANPGFVRNARLAYLRSAAKEVSHTEGEKWREKFTRKFDAGFAKKGGTLTVGCAAEAELELAWELATTFERSGRRELEEDLAQLLEELACLKHGGRRSVFQRAFDAISATYTDMKRFFASEAPLRIHPVIVFDELDKTTRRSAAAIAMGAGVGPEPAAGDAGDGAAGEDGHALEAADWGHSQGELAGDFLAKTVHTLKTVFTVPEATFIFISGEEHALLWSSDDTHPSFSAVFTDTFHLPRLSTGELETLVREHVSDRDRHNVDRNKLASALGFVSAGLLRSVVRLLREAQLSEGFEPREALGVDADRLRWVLEGGEFPEQPINAPSATIEQLALYHGMAFQAAEAMCRQINVGDVATAKSRVAGRKYALWDALYGASHQVIVDALQEMGARGRHPDLVAERLHVRLFRRPSVAMAARWFEDTHDPPAFLNALYAELVSAAVKLGVDESLTTTLMQLAGHARRKGDDELVFVPQTHSNRPKPIG